MLRHQLLGRRQHGVQRPDHALGRLFVRVREADRGIADVLGEQLDGVIRDGPHGPIGTSRQLEQFSQRQAGVDERDRRTNAGRVAGAVAVGRSGGGQEQTLSHERLEQGNGDAGFLSQFLELEQLVRAFITGQGAGQCSRNSGVRRVEVVSHASAPEAEQPPLLLPVAYPLTTGREVGQVDLGRRLVLLGVFGLLRFVALVGVVDWW